jgi:hypothetical protein
LRPPNGTKTARSLAAHRPFCRMAHFSRVSRGSRWPEGIEIAEVAHLAKSKKCSRIWNSPCTAVLGDVLYGIQPTDPVSFAFAVGMLLSVAACAAYVPAIRAARTDPMVALRCE